MKKRPIHKRIRDAIVYAAVVSLIRFLRSLNRRAAIKLMKGIGLLVFHLAKEERKKTIRHLTYAFSEEKSTMEINHLARQVFLHFSIAAADLLRLPVILKKGINSLITAEGLEHLDKVMAKGKGAVLITGHFGNWELLGAWLANNGYPLKVVGTPLDNEKLGKILVNTRDQAGYTNIARGSSSREIIRTLKEGKAIALLIDQDTLAQGLFVQFFGHPTHTPSGPAILARKFGVPILPIFMHLKEDLSYHIECEPPLELENTDDEEQDIMANVQKCSDVYERVIRKYPSQWAWMHKRWKTKPPVPDELETQ